MNSFRNDNDLLPEISARIQSEWVIDLSETSMTISHTSTGLRFRFEKDEHLEPRANFLDHEDHPQFENISTRPLKLLSRQLVKSGAPRMRDSYTFLLALWQLSRFVE